VLDPGALQEVLLVGGDYRLLPALPCESLNRLDVLPYRDVSRNPDSRD
jgi:hypothetical protein